MMRRRRGHNVLPKPLRREGGPGSASDSRLEYRVRRARPCGFGVRVCVSAGRGRVAQLVRALVSHTRGPGFESLRDHTHFVRTTAAASGFPGGRERLDRMLRRWA